jgi:flagellar basal-body rod protein FlgC
MLSAVQTALGGISRASAGVAAAANNVANLNTDGYRAQRLDSAGNSRPRHDTSVAPDPAPSDVDLAEEAVDMKRHEMSFRANVAAARVADRMNGELLDLLA